MRAYIVLIFILVFFVACGAQSKPDTPNTGVSEPESADTAASEISSETVDTLPTNISIEFPDFSLAMSNESFKSDLEYLENIVQISKLNFNDIKIVIPQILEECKDAKPCHFPEAYFVLEEENSTILGAIDFIRTDVKQTEQYELLLALSKDENLTFKWSEENNNMFTSYVKNDALVNLNYFIDIENNEVLFANDRRRNTNNSYVVTSSLGAYHLASNHMNLEGENFSTNTLIENEVEVESNAFELSSFQRNLEEGTYVLLAPDTSIEALSSQKVLELALGTFTLFKEKFQGLLYSSDFIESINKLTIVLLKNNGQSFERLDP